MYCFDEEYYLVLYESLRFGFFTPEIPAIIYYSHITAIVVTLLVGIFVFVKNKSLAARILFYIAIAFSTLALLDILLWTQLKAGVVMFIWSFWLSLFILIFGLSFYFLYTFITKKDVPSKYKVLFILSVVIIEIFSVTTLNLEYFDLAYCEAVEGVSMLNVVFGYSFLIFLGTVFYGFFATKRIQDPDRKHSSLLATIGIGCFLFVFSAATYIASIISLFFAEGHYVFLSEQYGYFGMTIFIGFLAYIIVRYRAFKIKFIATSALVIALILLIASQFLFVRSQAAVVLSALTLLLSLGFGYLLIQSVRREVQQREEIEKLAVKLEKANKRLKVLDKMKSEFVSIASHQLRSPLTAIRGYASMLLEGSYGKLTPKASEAVERISDSSRYMATSVEDYLNVSRIQAGNMKYELSDFNLKDKAEATADDIRREAMKKGLLLTFKSDVDKQGIVHADIGKVQQILHNLINNALKYTPKGMISVYVHDDKKGKRIMVDVIDSGIGMKPETIDDMFEKFERAENANNVNVSGTGLGLYIARKMANEMGGDVYATSPGEGLGSSFTLELPQVM